MKNLAVAGKERCLLVLVVRPTGHFAGRSNANALRRRANATEPLFFLFTVRIGDDHRARVYRESLGINLVLGGLFEEFLGVDHSTWTQEQFRIRSPLGARRQVIVFFRVGLCIDLVTGIRSAHTHQKIIFRRDMAHDVPLALASELTANQHINQGIVRPRIKIEERGGPDKDGFFAAAIRRDDDVRNPSEFLNVMLSPISLQLAISDRFVVVSAAFFIASAQFLLRGGQMDVMDSGTIGMPDRLNLTQDTYRVDDVEPLRGLSRLVDVNCTLQGFSDPGPAVLLVEPLSRSLQGFALGLGSGRLF